MAGHPKLGASWQGFALEHVISRLGARNCYFWGTHSGAELDLLAFDRGKRVGFEFKYSDAPSATKSMHSAISSLGLDSLVVVCPAGESYELDDRIHVRPLLHVVSEADHGTLLRRGYVGQTTGQLRTGGN